MGIWTRLFGTRRAAPDEGKITSSGVLQDRDGWYYEESQDYSSNQRTLRIDQDRPGDWYVHKSFCEVAGLNDPARAGEVQSFFAGTYRWLELERDGSDPHNRRVVKGIGTYRDAAGKQRRAHLGYLTDELADELAKQDIAKLWGRIRFIRFPRAGRRPGYWIRFDLMLELEEGTFD